MYTHKTRVAASQAGPDGMQTMLSVISMMQDCSQLWLESEPEMQQYFQEKHITQMLASRQVDFYRFAPYGAHLDVVTRVYGCKGFLGYRNTALYGADGTVYAQSWSIGAFVSLSTGKPTRLPPEIVEHVTYDPKLDMEYLDKRLRLPEAPPQVYPALTAARSDIDFNRHVNNAQHIRMACEYLPEGQKHGRMRVEYKKPAKQGDVLTPHIYTGSEGTVVAALLGEGQKPFAVVEFSKPF